MGLIDNKTYPLNSNNYYDDVYSKTQIIIGHTSRNNMLHYSGWINRLNGKNKNTATFTITKEGKIYQHFDPIYYSNFINKDQDKASISIMLENLGWFKKDVMIDRYVDWLGHTYRKDPSDVLVKKWRNYTYWERYTKEQMESLKYLVHTLCEEHNISKDFIGHNVYDENVDLFKGITFRSNYYQEFTDVNPDFDMNLLKNL